MTATALLPALIPTRRPTQAQAQIVINAVSAWMARTAPQPQVSERILIATETVTRTLVIAERKVE